MSADLRNYFPSSGSTTKEPPAGTSSTAKAPSRLSTLMGKASAAKTTGDIDTDAISAISLSESLGRGQAKGERLQRQDRLSDDDLIGVLGGVDPVAKGKDKASTSKRPRRGTGGAGDALRLEDLKVGSPDSLCSPNGGGNARGGKTGDTVCAGKRRRGGGAGSGGGVSASKMGPWGRKPEETALCAEDGYDPLELMADANREIFGNESFRDVQEKVGVPSKKQALS